MKKRLTAAVLAAAVTLISATAFAGEYYGNTQLPDLLYSDYTIEPVTAAEFDAAAEAVRNAASGSGFTNLMQLAEAFDKINLLAERQTRAYTLAYIQASQHNTAENNKRVDELYASATDMASKALKLITELADTPAFAGALASILGGEDMLKDLLNEQPTDKYFELSNREQELISEYHANSPETMVFTDENGNEYTLISLYDEMNELIEEIGSGELPDEAEFTARLARISALGNSAQEEASEKLGSLFKQLVNLRTEIAAEEGYSNYCDYAHSEIYFRDFNSADTAVFRDTVKKYIAPLYSMYSDYPASNYSFFNSLSNEEIISETGYTLESISPELKESFDFMTERGFLDICENEDRITQGTAYTISIPGSASPYTFISTSDLSPTYTYSTLIHEFGHYNAILRSGADEALTFDELFSESGEASIDLQEVYSQGLELLAADKYTDRFTLSDSSSLYMERLFSMLNSVLQGCLYDEWQEAVYKNPGMSIDDMNKLYSSLALQYGLDASPSDWIFVPHNFEQPMYYISYAVSAAAALDLWMQSIEDYDGAADRYMRLTAVKNPDSFRETLKAVGFDDIFDENQIIKIAVTLNSFYCGGYEDVADSGWYVDSARFTKPFFDNGDSNTLFRPEEPATRREAANTIGMLNSYTTGIEATGTTEFADAPNSPLISWTADAGIINGYTPTTFGPEDTLTREQAVTILYRYCEHEGLTAEPVSLAKEFDSFSDSGMVSDWAADAFKWAVSTGIIAGRANADGTVLAPQEPVKRAELAEMLRYMSYASGLRKTTG
ncbi:MAG: S-layer homology domain-containing protein [bacterium]|nr:S-layer homology domain-containing protein [bacterium]